MTKRQDLQNLLLTFVDNVYFQPPANTKLKYPCIIYKRDDIVIHHADNNPYKNKKRYQITIIDTDPDSTIHEKVAALPSCTYDRNFATENLNHDVLNLFF